MNCLRIFATPDGASHFDEVEIPLQGRSIFAGAVPFGISASYPASRIRFTRIPAGIREVAWHTVPERVLTVRLNGAVDYETSDGEVRHVSAGSFVLVEDTHGKGHISRHSPDDGVTPLGWTGSGRRFDTLAGVLFFKLHGAPIAQCRM